MAATVEHAPAAPKARRVTLVNVGLTLITAAALGLIVLGFTSGITGDASTTINDPAVERVIPHPGDLVLRQSEIGIDLAPGYRGLLVIDGQEIPVWGAFDRTAPRTPEGQIIDSRYDPGQNTVLFQPQEGATVQAFSPGRHKVTAEFWRDGVESRDQARQITWFFSVS